ncbi:DUF1289 domain-containing protein, partial [Morganella morganii]|nr:DUF1289 domain-containing protein [Morganella morganii]
SNAQKENVIRLCRQRRYRTAKGDTPPEAPSGQLDLF